MNAWKIKLVWWYYQPTQSTISNTNCRVFDQALITYIESPNIAAKRSSRRQITFIYIYKLARNILGSTNCVQVDLFDGQIRWKAATKAKGRWDIKRTAKYGTFKSRVTHILYQLMRTFAGLLFIHIKPLVQTLETVDKKVFRVAPKSPNNFFSLV